jgi:hypothetical protein
VRKVGNIAICKMRRSTYRTTAVIKIKKEEGQTFP